jgi:hypothetical protein
MVLTSNWFLSDSISISSSKMGSFVSFSDILSSGSCCVGTETVLSGLVHDCNITEIHVIKVILLTQLQLTSGWSDPEVHCHGSRQNFGSFWKRIMSLECRVLTFRNHLCRPFWKLCLSRNFHDQTLSCIWAVPTTTALPFVSCWWYYWL